MKKFFTSLKAFAILAMLTVAGNAMASSTYYAYYAQVNAVPEGKGTVYATYDVQAEAPTPDMYKSSSEVQFTAMYGNVYIYAQPADGYQLAGVSTATFNEAGEAIYNEDNITVSGENYTTMYADSEISGEEEAAVAAMMPMDPNNVYYALFTRVVAKPANEQMNRLGGTAISKVTNDNGDVITLTATPHYDESTKFAYWIKESTGEKITDNPLTLTVDGKDTYTAYFTSDLRIDIDFGTEPSYKAWYNDDDVFIGDFKTINFGTNSEWSTYMYDTLNVENNLRYSFFETYEAGYRASGKRAYLLYGQGVQTIIKDTTAVNSEETTIPESILKYAQTATNVAELPVSAKYYNVNPAERTLTLMAADAAIAEGTLYAAVPVDYLLEGYAAPATIYWSEEEVKGQELVTGIRNIVTDAPAAANIYSLDGKKLNQVTKPGVYVVNGKAVIIK